jgi:hypothetical protein
MRREVGVSILYRIWGGRGEYQYCTEYEEGGGSTNMYRLWGGRWEFLSQPVCTTPIIDGCHNSSSPPLFYLGIQFDRLCINSFYLRADGHSWFTLMPIHRNQNHIQNKSVTVCFKTVCSTTYIYNTHHMKKVINKNVTEICTFFTFIRVCQFVFFYNIFV